MFAFYLWFQRRACLQRAILSDSEEDEDEIAPRQPARKVRRGLVLSDDEDE